MDGLHVSACSSQHEPQYVLPLAHRGGEVKGWVRVGVGGEQDEEEEDDECREKKKLQSSDVHCIVYGHSSMADLEWQRASPHTFGLHGHSAVWFGISVFDWLILSL